MGFAFVAYEDQRSTVLAVDNLSGAKVAHRTIRVEHVDNYRRKKAEVGDHCGQWLHRQGLAACCFARDPGGLTVCWLSVSSQASGCVPAEGHPHVQYV